MPTKKELQDKLARATEAKNNPNASPTEKESWDKVIVRTKAQLAELGGAEPETGKEDSAEIQKLKADIKTQEDLIKEGNLPPNIKKSLEKKLNELKNKLKKREGAPAKKEGAKRGRKTAAEKAAKETPKPAAKPKRKLPVKTTKPAAKPKHKRISPKKAEPKKPEKKGKKDYSGLSKDECIKRLKKAEKANEEKRKDYADRKKKGLPAAKTPAEVVGKASKSVAKKVKAIVKSKGEITKGEADKTKLKIADIVEVIIKAIPEKKDKVVWLKELCAAVLKRVKINPKDFKMS